MPAAQKIIGSFEIADSLYAIGTRERRVTLFSQQTRALNLVWAMTELEPVRRCKLRKIAIIGAGAAGLTAAAALLGLESNEREIWLFERQWDLCPMQIGCDGRWLHPRIYNWPDVESRNPSAGLPVLNWSEGRASDIARVLLEGFNKYRLQGIDNRHQLNAYVGVHYLKINAKSREITWVGTRADFDESPYALRGATEGATTKFDAIIVAAGFGFERVDPKYPTSSYWRNDQFAQLHRDPGRKQYVVSGYGDGALIDLCRLTIDRFRQDTVLYEIFGSSLEAYEQILREKLFNQPDNLLQMFDAVYDDHLAEPKARLQRRVREDTSVILNISGGKPRENSFDVVFGPGSSVLNRLLVYLLFRCGAIAIEHHPVGSDVDARTLPDGNVIIRHGCDTPRHLSELFDKFDVVKSSFETMYNSQRQIPKPCWPPGYYPVLQAA